MKMKETKRICHQQTCSTKMAKGSSSDRKEMIIEWNSEHWMWKKKSNEYKVHTLFVDVYSILKVTEL
jgi:hypothetical protein